MVEIFKQFTNKIKRREYMKKWNAEWRKTDKGRKYYRDYMRNYYRRKKAENNNQCYTGLHEWVRSSKGKPIKCTQCGISANKVRIYWANIDHKYRRNLDDYIALCAKCHYQHDTKL